MSFAPNGTPCSDGSSTPSTTSCLAARALARARSGSRTTQALSRGSISPARASSASTSSTGDTSRWRISRAACAAVNSCRAVAWVASGIGRQRLVPERLEGLLAHAPHGGSRQIQHCLQAGLGAALFTVGCQGGAAQLFEHGQPCSVVVLWLHRRHPTARSRGPLHRVSTE